MIELGGWEISQQALLLGAAQGLGYALLAVGVVLIYRASGVISFAQAEIGAFASTLAAVLVGNYGVPFWLALAAAVAAAAGWAATIELVVVRRLFLAPRVVVLIATVGAAQLVFLATLHLPNVTLPGAYPTALSWELDLSDQLRFDSRLSSLVLLSVPLVLGLALVLARTRFGSEVRAAAENQDAARLIGISPRRISTLVWTIAGAVAGLTAVLLAPLSGGAAGAHQEAGTGLLLRALAVALLARMRSIPACLAGGVVVGVGQAVMLRNTPDQPGSENLFLLVVVLGAVLLTARSTRGRQRPADPWLAGATTPPPPVAGRERWWVRHAGRLAAAGALAAAGLLPFAATRPSQLTLWSEVALVAVVVVSVTILAGWGGQLSLGQFAFFGLGACVTVVVSNGFDIPVPFDAFTLQLRLDFSLAVLVGTAVGALAALLVGLPALRVQGLLLAVTTLAFATAAQTWLFRQDLWTDGQGRVRPLSRPVPFESPRAFYFLCLGVAALTVVTAQRLRRWAPGRNLIATRDNEELAAACTLSPARQRLVAFAFAGGLAALAGGLYATLLVGFTPEREFTALRSLDVVAMAVIGGLGSVVGAVLGALWVLGLPALFDGNESVRLATSGIGLLVLLMYLPGGLAGTVSHAWDGVLRWLARAASAEPSPRQAATERPLPARPVRPARADADALPLDVRDLTVRFGSRVVVDRANLEVRPGEVVALIGTNGAGKSTLLNAVGGFVAATGTVAVLGRPVQGLAAHRRHGEMIRGFQAARLFPGLTVRETVQVALEGRGHSGFGPALLRLPPAPGRERARRAEADEIVDYLGLGRYADQLAGTLSTGTRRIAELGCLLAVGGRVLLLDEPTGGLAQREAERIGPLIQRIRAELDGAVLLVEHDMAVVMGISDRVYCLEAGRVIAEGPPATVRDDPAVVASYLGTTDRAPDLATRT